MHIKSNTNLEKDIINYNKNYINNLTKKDILIRRILYTTIVTLSGVAVSPVIITIIDDTVKPIWPIIFTESFIIGLTNQHFIFKSFKKAYETARKNLFTIINVLTKKDIITDEQDIANSKITKETTKVIRHKFNPDDVIETTIKRFYFLDNQEQIRILKEVRKTILNENKKKETTTELYLEDTINEEMLPVKKTLSLNLK